MQEERRRILDMLAEDRISVEQAEALLRALSGSDARPEKPQPPVPPQAPKVRHGARSLQILVSNEASGKHVNVTVPLGLVKFARKFVPASAQLSIEESGIDLQQLLDSIDDPDGIPPGTTLASIQSENEGNGGTDSVVIKAV